MPTYDGYKLFGYVRMRPEAHGGDGVCNEQLLSEGSGDVYRWGGSHYGRTTLRTMTTDTTITLSSGVSYAGCIMVKRVDGIQSNYFNTTTQYNLTFYAPNVGLVKEVQVYWPDTTIRELIDHQIGAH